MGSHGWVRAGAALVVVAACGGCGGIYLHDDALQKQTDSVLSDYKAANVTAAVTATLTAQSQFDAQLLNSMVAQDTIDREAELSGLLIGRNMPRQGDGANLSAKIQGKALPFTGEHLLSTPFMSARQALRYRIANRLFDLGALNEQWTTWQNRFDRLVQDQATLNNTMRQVKTDADAYIAAGGKDFTACPFKPADGLTEVLGGAARNLVQDCEEVANYQALVAQDKAPLLRVAGGGGLVGGVEQRLKDVVRQFADDQVGEESAKAQLKTAQDKVDQAKTAPAGNDVTTLLTDANTALQAANGYVGVLGQPGYSPSALLATIKFRKTNLCDVLAAGAGRSCTGATPTTQGSAVYNAIGGLVSGISDLKKVGDAPASGTLAVALAYQTGLEAVAQAQVNGLQAQQALLLDEEAALTQEIELLLEARAALSAVKCDAAALGDMMKDKNCSVAAIAEVLAAYNLSWARGRTGALIDERKQLQVLYMTTLQVSQANAVARDGVITTALTALDTYGQGGIPPATIAAFLQVIAQGAIAKGVN